MKLLLCLLFCLFCSFTINAQVRLVRSGTTLPATCRAGPPLTDVFIKTDTDKLYICASTNTWVLDDTGSGGGGLGDLVGPSASTDSELPLFSSTTGKLLKRSNTLNGYIKVASGVVTAQAIPFSDLSGSITDAQVPNTITIDLATTATTANAGDSATSFFSAGTIEAARILTVVNSRCVRINGSGVLEAHTGDCGSGGGSGDALVANPLSQFATTTSAQLAGVLSDEEGTAGGFVRATGSTIAVPALTLRTQANNTAIVANSPYVNTADGKLMIGNAAGTANGEIFVAGVSMVSLTTNVTGILPAANILATVTNSRCLRVNGSGVIEVHTADCGAGGGITNSAGNNILMKSNGTNAVASLFTDTGTTATYTGTGGVSAPSFTGTGSGAGYLELPQGTAPSLGTTSIQFVAPAAVTSYQRKLAGAAATGIPHFSNSANVITETISAIDLSTADVSGILGAARFPALTGDITTSSGSVATTISNNVVTGAKIALGSDAQGDIMYYNGTDYARLAPGTNGQFLKTQGAAANPVWATATGTGDFVGPASSTDNAIVRFDSTTGKLGQNSGVTIDDSNNMTVPGNLTVTGNVTTGDGTVAGETVLNELAADTGDDYFSWLGVDSRATILRARIPSADPAAGNVMLFGAPSSTISTVTFGGLSSISGSVTDAQVPNNITVDLATAVTTNANLTGHVTSVGNAAVLGSFTFAQLNTAISDADVARTDAANTFTGVQSMTSPAITTSLTSPSSTFALLNVTPTTINFAGAATILNIGASAAQVLNFGGFTTAAEFRFLEPSGSGTNYSAFKAVAQGASITYSLPPTVGAAGTVLTDVAGNGVLTWAAGGSGGITNSAANTQVMISNGTNATGDADLTFATDTLTATKLSSTELTLTGSGAGVLQLTEGSAPALVANSFQIYAGVDVAAGGLAYRLPTAGATGFMLATNTSGDMVITHVASSGTGSVCLTVSCSMTTPALGTPASGVVTNLTGTLTNIVYDAAATGNVFTSTFQPWFPAAGCNSATASSFYDLGTSLAPTPVCKNSGSGATAQDAALDFPDSDGMYFAISNTMLPSDFTGTVDAKIKWKAAATTGDVIWNVSTICVADGEVDNPSFNTASSVTDTTKGTTLQANHATIASVTITGCAAGEEMYFKISRDRTTSGDTIAGVVSFLGLQFTTSRAQ